jgi:hypothetical protein
MSAPATFEQPAAPVAPTTASLPRVLSLVWVPGTYRASVELQDGCGVQGISVSYDTEVGTFDTLAEAVQALQLASPACDRRAS